MAVNYDKINWENRVVQRPRTYTETANSDSSVTHTPAPGTIVQAGTPRSAENMDHMDQGIKDCANAINEMLGTLQQMLITLNNYNTRIQNNERDITAIQQVDERQSQNIARVTEAHNALAQDEAELEEKTDEHIANQSNPHRVTKEQIGLGNVSNLAPSNLNPTWTEATSDQNLASGETLSSALGKLARGLKRLWAHIARTDNPHNVTKAQVGLGNVPNVTTNNQTPSYSVADEDRELTSGETMATAFGKLKRAVKRLYEHIANTDNPHNTGFFDVGKADFPDAWGEPDIISTYTGNGSTQATISVNGVNVRGQQIDIGFPPSRVAIMIDTGEEIVGHGEDRLGQYTLLQMMYGKKVYAATFAPGLNYYHSGCGTAYRTSTPEVMLSRGHGGAVVYGNGFIVSAYNNYDNDTIMRVNSKGVRYLYMAWR